MSKKKPPGKPPNKQVDDDDQDQDGSENESNDSDEDSDEDQNKRINAIVTSRVKREMKGVLAQLSTLTDAIGKLSQKPPQEDDEDQDDDSDNSGEVKTKPEAKTVDPKLARKMSKLENELKEERDARKKAEQAQRDEQEKAKRHEMVGIFESALTEHGVTDPKLRRAALRLLEEDGYMVRDDESGKIKFKGTDKYGMETLLDPKAGVKTWVLGDGKSFVPAVDAGGSGTGAARQGLGNGNITKGEFGKMSPAQKAAIELERASMGLPPVGEQ